MGAIKQCPLLLKFNFLSFRFQVYFSQKGTEITKTRGCGFSETGENIVFGEFDLDIFFSFHHFSPLLSEKTLDSYFQLQPIKKSNPSFFVPCHQYPFR